MLKAEWAKTISATNEELAELKKSEYEGRIAVSLDRGGVLTSCEVNYQTDGFALVGVSELENDPMNNAAGLIGSPVEILNVGGEVKEAVIKFYSYHTSKAIDIALSKFLHTTT